MGGVRALALVMGGALALLATIESCTVDPFLMCGDACEDGGIVDAAFDSSDSSAPPDGSTSCDPKTCDNFPSDCHPSLDDGCGNTIDCSNACPASQDCIADAGPDASGFFCNGPPICKDAGAPGGNCSAITNPGTGQTTDCGNCLGTGFTCANSTCSCSGTTCGGPACCSGATPNCNDANNGCCKRRTCANDYPGKCSAASDDGCGGTIDCSTSCTGLDQVCDVATSRCCLPNSKTSTCNNRCGTVLDNCEQPVDCGITCGNGDICEGSASCTCGTVTCTPGQSCRLSPDECL